MRWEINQKVDIKRGAQGIQLWPNSLMILGDNEAHIWKIKILDNGEDIVVSGTVTGYFVRPDGNTIMVVGTLEGNIASVILPQAVYAQKGNVQAIMRLTAAGGQVVTLSSLILPVRAVLTDSIIDPGEVIPSLDDLLAQIAAMEEATARANAAGLNFRGDYTPDADPLYAKRDMVFFNGGSYAYTNNTPSNEIPTSKTHWQQIASMGGQDLVDAAEAARDLAEGYRDEAEGYAAQLVNFVSIGESNGVDDTAHINELLSNGGVVRGTQGQIYLISSPLIIGSNTTLDMTGCVVKLKQDEELIGDNLLQNSSIRSLRSVVDAEATLGSYSILSATANFTSDDIGRAISVYGAGGDSLYESVLTANIKSVESPTSITISIPVKRTVTGATVRVYNRDHDIRVIGGYWDRGANHTSLSDAELGLNGLHGLSFRHVDYITIDIEAYHSTNTGAKYAVLLGDATYASVSVRHLDTISDGVHIIGPARNIDIPFLAGKTGDDFISLTGGDYNHYSDTAGDIDGVHVGVAFMSDAKAGYKIVPGSGNHLDHFKADYTSGSCENYACWIEEDRSYSNSSGGSVGKIDLGIMDINAGASVVQVSNITVEMISVEIRGGFGISAFKVFTQSMGQETRIKNILINNPTFDGHGKHGIYIQDNAIVENLTINNAVVKNRAILVNCNVANNIKNITVNGLKTEGDPADTSVIRVVNADNLYLDGVSINIPSTALPGNGIISGTIDSISIINANIRDLSNKQVLFNDGASSIFMVSHSVINGLKRVMDYFSGTAVFNNCKIDTTLEAVAVYGDYYIASNTLLYDTTKKFVTAADSMNIRRVNGEGIGADVTKLTPVRGDVANNLSANELAGWYIGTVKYDGEKWVPLRGYAASGEAYLSSGTVTVAHARIKNGSRIRLFVKMPTGVPGALYLSSIASGTGFTISSTSNADNSLVRWEIITY